MSQRLIAVSDIHGHYEEFIQLMKDTGYVKGKDKLYILGDIVDRGPDSFKVLTLIRNLQMQYPDTVTVIRGNHDDEFLKIAKLLYSGTTLENDDWELYAGFTQDGLQTIAVYNELCNDNDKAKLIQWLDNLPYYAEHGNFIFVHAAVDPTIKDMKHQTDQMLLWGRKGENDIPFSKIESFKDKVVIFGHVCTRTLFKQSGEPITNNVWYDMKHYDKIGIDCGCWVGGQLGALIIHPDEDKYEEVYV